jgi:hypothetical protein
MMRKLALLISVLVVVATPSPAGTASHTGTGRLRPAPGARVALVIGNGAYRYHDPLRNPVNDAAGVAQALAGLGFRVIHKPDLTRAEMMQAIEEFGARIAGSEAALFYYAGHGVQIKGTNYLIPVDAKITDAGDVDDQAVNVDSLFETMWRARAGLNIIILDACRDNPFRGLSEVKAAFLRDLAPGLAPPRNAPAGTLIAYATDPGRVASDGSGHHSPYTRALLRYMPQPGLKLDDLFKRVREHVIENTDGEQTPWENTSVVGDDFFFRPPAFIECKIDAADDEAYVFINDSPAVVSTSGGHWYKVQLKPGANSLEIKVYNQKTRRGLLGPREGWRYVIKLRTPDWERVFQESEDTPPDERWGKTFTRVRTTIDVDENTGLINIR